MGSPVYTSEERNKQLCDLKRALDLQQAINSNSAKLSRLRTQAFRNIPEKPQAPVKEIIPAPVYPDPNAEMTLQEYFKTCTVLHWIIFVVVSVAITPIVTAILVYFDFKKTKPKYAEKVRMTPEYKERCAAIDREVREKQINAERRYADKLAAYDRALHEYNTVVLPKYEQEKRAWDDQRRKEIAILEVQNTEQQKELAAHYEATKVIPVQYRSFSTLKYIYDLMSTSNFTISQAIANYEQRKQRDMEAERLRTEQARYEQQRRAAEAEERAADAAEAAAEAAYRAEQRASERSNTVSYSYYEAPQPKPQRKKNYYATAHCPRTRLSGPKTCAGCTLAPMCTTGSGR